MLPRHWFCLIVQSGLSSTWGVVLSQPYPAVKGATCVDCDAEPRSPAARQEESDLKPSQRAEKHSLRQIDPSRASTARRRGSAKAVRPSRARKDALSGAPRPTATSGPGCSSRSTSHVHAEKRCPESQDSSPP